jgi:hypothetical protein
MPIQIVELELENWDGFDIHCPACGTVAFADGDPDPCQHVEFVEFSDGDICYVREDLEAVVDEWREETEAKDEEWDARDGLGGLLPGHARVRRRIRDRRLRRPRNVQTANASEARAKIIRSSPQEGQGQHQKEFAGKA